MHTLTEGAPLAPLSCPQTARVQGQKQDADFLPSFPLPPVAPVVGHRGVQGDRSCSSCSRPLAHTAVVAFSNFCLHPFLPPRLLTPALLEMMIQSRGGNQVTVTREKSVRTKSALSVRGLPRQSPFLPFLSACHCLAVWFASLAPASEASRSPSGGRKETGDCTQASQVLAATGRTSM